MRILKGQPFDSEKLEGLKQQLGSVPVDQLPPIFLSDAAVIRQKLFEMKLGQGAIQSDAPDIADLNAALQAALSTNPNSSYLWLVDYWLSRLRGDAIYHSSKLLRLSYATGPNEAWIAQRRNPIALEAWQLLPVDLVQQVLSEFARLVQSGLYEDAANIVAGPGWAIHQQLLNAIAPLDESDRHAMARALARKDLDGVSVPGIPNKPPSRPF